MQESSIPLLVLSGSALIRSSFFLVVACSVVAQNVPAPTPGTLSSGRSVSADQPFGATLSLAQAQTWALQHQPALASAVSTQQGSEQVVKQARSGYYPTAAINITSAVANDGTVIASGLLQTSSLNSRFATGLNLLGLITDFGRTNNLVQAAKFRYRAAGDEVLNVRAQILLSVRQAFFGVLGSEAVQRAAAAALENRQITLRQVSALQQSSLRSTLDVTFARVTVSEAQLAVDQAENDLQANRAALAASLGLQALGNVRLQDTAIDSIPLDPNVDALVASAMRERPDLKILIDSRDAANSLARAERKLSLPSLSYLATAGAIPEHDHTIARDQYEAAGINVNIPVFNGGLYAARRTEAEFRAQAADKDVQNLSVAIARDVRTAWANANNSFRRLSVTRQLVDQARQAVHLAQARYDAGLGSIVELNQAQTSEISAEIDAASAQYGYLSRTTELQFTTGVLQ